MTKHNFEAETGKILELLTHSIYSNKEIFLRELISNASDAIDKARLKSLTDTTFLGDDSNFEIKLMLDEKANTITLIDNWIGMTEQELHDALGTIARSGTKEFMEKLEKAKETQDHNLIGQFGVGFYSAFMVADKVEVETRSPLDKKAHKWISDGKSAYEVSESSKETRGTQVTLFIDEANKELVTESKIRELVRKYSNYVAVPVMLEAEQKDEKGESTREKEFEQINETKAIWKKSKSSVKPEEYEEFYKSVSMDFNKPLAHVHTNIEWVVSYSSLLFVPSQKNMFQDLSDPNKEYGPKLYVQNVLILENAKDLLPVWMRFVSGVVETSDLPLNISREMLQSNAVLDKIKSGLQKKIIAELKKTMVKSPEDYDKFLADFGQLLKEGIYYEAEKEPIAEVIKFKSLLKNKMITLDEYLESFKWEDKHIYFINGKSESEVLASPYLAQFRENNVDVLLLTDPVDAFLIQAFKEYKKVNLKSVTAGDITLKEETKEDKEKKEKKVKEFKDFLELTKNIVSADKLEKVELNENLGDALAALKTPENGVDPQMEKMMKAMGQAVPAQKRILELNPNNKLMKAMKKEFKADIKSKKLSDLMHYAYNSAVLLEGGEIENMSEFVTMTNTFAGEYIK